MLSSQELLQNSGAKAAQVEIFLTEDSFLPEQDFYLKLERVVASSSVLTEQDTVLVNRMKIIVFDDVPCWANTKGITRFLNRCLQAPAKCKGVLFIVTSNDGWCQDTYCNADPELDDKFVGFLEELQRNALAHAPLKGGGAGLTKARDGRFVIENRCRDVEQRGEDVMYEHCSIGKSPLSKEECEYRGCCCVSYDSGEG